MNSVFSLKMYRLLALLCAFMALASCGQKKRMGVIKIPNCPAVGFVAHTSSLTRFTGDTLSSEDVAFDALLTDLDFKCVESTKAIETTISFTIDARKGPALKNFAQEVRYFVVVLRDDYQITNKRSFSTEIQFNSKNDTANVRETVVQRFEDITAPARYRYEVLIGFELSPEEIKFTTIR